MVDHAQLEGVAGFDRPLESFAVKGEAFDEAEGNGGFVVSVAGLIDGCCRHRWFVLWLSTGFNTNGGVSERGASETSITLPQLVSKFGIYSNLSSIFMMHPIEFLILIASAISNQRTAAKHGTNLERMPLEYS